MPQRLEGDTHIEGTLTAKTVSLPANTVTNAAVRSDAAISASKMEHQHRKTFAQEGTATSVTRAVHVARAAGTVRFFYAGSIAIAVGAATVTLDLRKNGTTILTGVITLDSANTARVVESGTLTGNTVVAGDVLEVVTVATAGGGTLPTGVFAEVGIDETYAAA